MKLSEVLDQVDSLDDEFIVVARKPWTLESDAEVTLPTSDSRVPDAIKSRGLDYFLEVSVALEVLAVLEGRAANNDERRRLLLYYAEHDAYPSWACCPGSKPGVGLEEL